MKKITLENSSTTANQADNTDYSEKLIDRTPLEGTPFTLITTEEGYFLTFGKYKVSELVNNQEQLIDMVLEKEWNLLLNVFIAINKEIK